METLFGWIGEKTSKKALDATGEYNVMVEKKRER